MKLKEALLKIFVELPEEYKPYEDMEVPLHILYVAEEHGWQDSDFVSLLAEFTETLKGE